MTIVWALAGCSDDGAEDRAVTGESADDGAVQASAGFSEDDTWAIYWYLCGSDLESNSGAATQDLMEMMEVALPDNIQVVIQTGGAYQWQNDFVNPDVLGRYLFSSNGLEQVDELPSASMGDATVLKDFLAFCKENYPADHTMVLFWNHGGGSVAGAELMKCTILMH